MHVVLFHPASLPPRDYGGTERVVLWLAAGLRALGHQVTVAAFAGSQLPPGCQLLAVNDRPYSATELAALLPGDLDVVHFMAPLAAELWASLPWPALVTIHGNGKKGERFPRNTVFLSQNHAKRHQADFFIYNGIDPSEVRFAPQSKQDWFLFLSKTSWSVKNLAGAMRFCRQAQVFLKIAGGERPWHLRLAAGLSRHQQWIGPVSGTVKQTLLSEAKALLFPVLWPEPFGLVVVEALMSGTPVLASSIGSLPELVPPHVGALIEPQFATCPWRLQAADEQIAWSQWHQQWVEQLTSPRARWEPEACRAWAMQNFHFHQMAQAYEKAYRQVLAGQPLQAIPPQQVG